MSKIKEKKSIFETYPQSKLTFIIFLNVMNQIINFDHKFLLHSVKNIVKD